MKVSGGWLRQEISIGLVMLLMTPFGVAATTPGQQEQSQNPQQLAGEQNPQQNGTSSAPNETSNSGTPGAASNSQLPTAPQAAGEPSSSSQATQQSKLPLGTAAAPVENPVGVAVSRPAGAAIAPAKQRRARTFLIRMSLVIGAAVAVGTVVALSKASPSRPH